VEEGHLLRSWGLPGKACASAMHPANRATACKVLMFATGSASWLSIYSSYDLRTQLRCLASLRQKPRRGLMIRLSRCRLQKQQRRRSGARRTPGKHDPDLSLSLSLSLSRAPLLPRLTPSCYLSLVRCLLAVSNGMGATRRLFVRRQFHVFLLLLLSRSLFILIFLRLFSTLCFLVRTHYLG
jgi:hypothetical protein